jgi:hypothetical protein
LIRPRVEESLRREAASFGRQGGRIPQSLSGAPDSGPRRRDLTKPQKGSPSTCRAGAMHILALQPNRTSRSANYATGRYQQIVRGRLIPSPGAMLSVMRRLTRFDVPHARAPPPEDHKVPGCTAVRGHQPGAGSSGDLKSRDALADTIASVREGYGEPPVHVKQPTKASSMALPLPGR